VQFAQNGLFIFVQFAQKINMKIIKQQNVSHNCIVCGLKNEAALRAQFAETDGGVLICVPNPRKSHEGYPNRMHGGIIAALLDETIGRAIQIHEPDTWGVTASLELKYIKPVPLDAEIYVTGKITESFSRLFKGEGRVCLAATGEVLASASAKYVKLPVDKIADTDFLHTQWLEEQRPAPDLSRFVFLEDN